MRHAVVEGLGFNFGQLGFFNVYPMHGRQMFLHFAPIKLWPGFDPAPSGLAAQRQSNYAATAGSVT